MLWGVSAFLHHSLGRALAIKHNRGRREREREGGWEREVRETPVAIWHSPCEHLSLSLALDLTLWRVWTDIIDTSTCREKCFQYCINIQYCNSKFIGTIMLNMENFNIFTSILSNLFVFLFTLNVFFLLILQFGKVYQDLKAKYTYL